MGNKWFEDCNGDMVKVFGLVDPNTKDDPLIVWSVGVMLENGNLVFPMVLYDKYINPYFEDIDGAEKSLRRIVVAEGFSTVWMD